MTWAIGDLQGCFGSFMKLLDKIQFDKQKDTIWLVGDLVNRGEDSLKTLEYIYANQNNFKVVLGNHDISLIAAYYGIKKSNLTIEPILKSPNAKNLIEWLKSQPFLYIDDKLGYCMSHAGISPLFNIDEAIQWNNILQKRLMNENVSSWLEITSKNRSSSLQYNNDDVYALASFIRMRYCFDDGVLELEEKDGVSSDKRLRRWFESENRKNIPYKIIFGHWSTLGFYKDENVIALDTGCVWGGKLTAFCLETQETRSISCRSNMKNKSFL